MNSWFHFEPRPLGLKDTETIMEAHELIEIKLQLFVIRIFTFHQLYWIITYHYVIQNPGECMVTASAAYHQWWNAGPSEAEAITCDLGDK